MMDKPRPKSFDGLCPNSIGKNSEEELAKLMEDGHLVPGSGCGSRKGDFGYQEKDNNRYKTRHLFEHKCTQNKSLKFKGEWLEKRSRQAFCEGKDPVLTLCFDGGVDFKYGERVWGMVPVTRLKELLDKEKRLEELERRIEDARERCSEA